MKRQKHKPEFKFNWERLLYYLAAGLYIFKALDELLFTLGLFLCLKGFRMNNPIRSVPLGEFTLSLIVLFESAFNMRRISYVVRGIF